MLHTSCKEAIFNKIKFVYDYYDLPFLLLTDILTNKCLKRCFFSIRCDDFRITADIVIEYTVGILVFWSIH